MKYICLYIILFFNLVVYAGNSEFQNLSLTDQGLALRQSFQNSMTFYNGIIESPQVSKVDKAKTYFLKYELLKKMGIYSEALLNLDLAFDAGKTSSNLAKITLDYQLEKSFFYVENMQYMAALKELQQIHTNTVISYNANNNGLYLFLNSIVAMDKNNRPDQAIKLANEAIGILKQKNTDYLPVIYRELLRFYSKNPDSNKVEQIYNLGLEVAYENLYASEILQINRFMAVYYKEIGQIKQSLELSDLVLKQATAFNLINISSSVSYQQKKELLLQNLDRDNKHKTYHTLLIGSLGVLGVLVLLGTIWLIRVKKNNKELLSKNHSIEENPNQENPNQESLTQNLKQPKEDFNDIIETQELSLRQKQIVELVRQGKSNKEIAAELFISHNTVKYHLKIIFAILQVKDRHELMQK